MTTVTLPNVQDIPVVWKLVNIRLKRGKKELSPSPSFHSARLANGSLTIAEFNPAGMTTYLQQVPFDRMSTGASKRFQDSPVVPLGKTDVAMAI